MLYKELPGLYIMADSFAEVSDMVGQAMQAIGREMPTEEDIIGLMDGSVGVFADGSYDTVRNIFDKNPSVCIVPAADSEKARNSGVITPKDGEILIGVKAIEYLISLGGKEAHNLTVLNSIHIPVDVFSRCCVYNWHDICSLFSVVSLRADRLRRLAGLADTESPMPAIIFSLEYRNLWEAIQMLNHNGYTVGSKTFSKRMRNDSVAMRSLYDVDYDIVNGWSKEALEAFENEEED